MLPEVFCFFLELFLLRCIRGVARLCFLVFGQFFVFFYNFIHIAVNLVIQLGNQELLTLVKPAGD